MAKIIDFEARRQPRADQSKDRKAADLRAALQGAREDAAGKSSASKLLDIYRPKKPKKP